MTRALVTGADGFVGRHLCAHLRARGDETTGVDRDCDVTDASSVFAVLEQQRPDVIYHLAALTHVGESWGQASEFTRVNVVGTQRVLQAAREVVPEATVVYVSTADVYGVLREEDLPVGEEFRVAPQSPYATSKVEAEHVARDAVRHDGQRVVIARPFNHIGPGQARTFAVPAIASRLLEARRDGRATITVGDLSPRRDFSDVRDVVRAYALLGEYGAPGEIYHVASGRDVALSELVAMLVAIIAPGTRLEVDEALLRPVEIPFSCGDASKLRAATGWRPEISLEQSLHDVVASLEIPD
ncbi:MAG TPA: GDP-mannose 4,6-dehydratase [Acidimicrobiales bacterium]|nr:GDP-mannose 4,6-dehydratase [Acidimicrobiales bacterium]